MLRSQWLLEREQNVSSNANRRRRCLEIQYDIYRETILKEHCKQNSAESLIYYCRLIFA